MWTGRADVDICRAQFGDNLWAHCPELVEGPAVHQSGIGDYWETDADDDGIPNELVCTASMADYLSLNHIDDVFGDIRSMVGYAFEVP